MKRITVIAAASFAINTFLVLKGRGSFFYTLLPMAVSLWIGLPLVLVSAIVFAVAAKRKSYKVKNFARIGLSICLLIHSSLVSIPFGSLLLKRDMKEATTFCDTLVPELEKIRRMTGGYPKDLSTITKSRKTPRLLSNQDYYISEGTSFTFDIIDPSAVMGGVYFSSKSREWSRWD